MLSTFAAKQKPIKNNLPVMRKLIISTIVILCCMTMNAQTTAYNSDRGFIHPGGMHTQADFDRVKQQLKNGNPTVTSAYNLLKRAAYAQPGVTTAPSEQIVRGGNGQNYINAARGATMAYQNALRWKIEGNEACAQAAVRVLMAWANTTKTVTGNSDAMLAAGIYGYQFAQAAELMRDYEGWSREDFQTFQQWMLDVWYRPSINFLRARNGTWENGGKWWQAPGHYWSNWGLCNALCVISIGILCDDVFIYNQGLSFMKHDQCGTWTEPRTQHDVINHSGLENTTAIWNDGLTEFLGNLVVTTSESELETGAYGMLGQMNESGRDAGHPAMALGLAVDIAHTLYNQGDDLFAFMDHRLAAGIEYIAAQILSVEGLPWTNYQYITNGNAFTDYRSWVMTEPALGVQIRPCWGTVIGHYEGVKGVKMPFSEQVLTKMGIDGGGGGSVSGGYDQLGYSVLMNTRDKQICPEEQVPTELQGYIEVNGKMLKQNAYGGLVNKYTTNNTTSAAKIGQTVTLKPQLPDGEEDTGKWLWNTGETTRDITISTDHSYVYRVTYTNNNGIESQQSFPIAVMGDCRPMQAFSTTITYGGSVVGRTEATVPSGSKVTLGISGVDFGSWEWWTGSKAATITTGKIERDTTFVVTAINQGGARTERIITIKVRDDDRPTSGLIYYHDFENEPDADGLLPDSLGYYPAMLCGSAVRRFLDDNNWAVYTGTNKGYIDLGSTIGADVMSTLKTNYTISLDLCVTTPNSLSSFCWAWAFSNGTTQYSALVNKAGGSNWYYEIKDGTASQVNSNTSLTVNKWHTVTLVQKATTATLYIDGVEKSTASISLKPSTIGYQLADNWLGRSPYSGDAYMTNTYVDNLRIYNTALSATQVQALAHRRPTSKKVGDPTGIEDVSTSLSHIENEHIYTLSGQRVLDSKLRRGIYIVNGKKVCVK